jgi:hypothetical protein
MSPYEASLKLRRIARRKLRSGYQFLGETSPDVETPGGMFRFTVIFNDGLGESLFLPANDLQKNVRELTEPARLLKFDLDRKEDVNRARNLLYHLLKSGERDQRNCGAVLGLFLSWNLMGELISDHVKRKLDEHGKACLTLAIDWRLGHAATTVTEDYVEPFAALGALVAATVPVQGTA